MGHVFFAPIAPQLDAICVGFYLIDLSLGIFAQRRDYFVKWAGASRAARPQARRVHQWQLYRTACGGG